jgi:predicted transcriptional regulator
MNTQNIQLTKAEEQLMQILWGLGKATVMQALDRFDEPKPARTTVATVFTILENKGFVTHNAEGRNNIYRPLLQKSEYSKNLLFGVMNRYFNNSFASMASFFAKENNLTLKELDEILEETRQEIKSEK